MLSNVEKLVLERKLVQLTELFVRERPNAPLPAFIQLRIEQHLDALHGKLESYAVTATRNADITGPVNPCSEPLPQEELAASADSDDFSDLKRTAPLLPRSKRKLRGRPRRRIRI